MSLSRKQRHTASSANTGKRRQSLPDPDSVFDPECRLQGQLHETWIEENNSVVQQIFENQKQERQPFIDSDQSLLGGVEQVLAQMRKGESGGHS